MKRKLLQFDRLMDSYVRNHPYRAFFAMFVGLPVLVMAAVCTVTLAVVGIFYFLISLIPI